MTATIVDFEIIEALDFDFAPPCEMTPKCGKAAVWKVTLSCCGALVLLCEGCKIEVMDMAKIGPVEHGADFGGCGSKDVRILVCERI